MTVATRKIPFFFFLWYTGASRFESGSHVISKRAIVADQVFNMKVLAPLQHFLSYHIYYETVAMLSCELNIKLCHLSHRLQSWPAVAHLYPRQPQTYRRLIIDVSHKIPSRRSQG